MDIVKGYIFSLLYGVLCIILGLIAYKLGMPKRYSRKVVHVLVGFEWLILYHYMGAGLHFLIVCLAFTLLLAVSYFKKLMPMISSDSDNAPGTVYYGVAMSIMAIISAFVPEMIVPFGVGVFATSVGDGFAGVFGQLIKKYNPKIYGNKTILGSFFNFVFSSCGAFIFNFAFDLGLKIWQCLAVGLLAMGIELIAGRGLDNIVITVAVSLFTYALAYHSIVNIFVVPIILTPIVIAVVTEKKVLTPCGLALAIVLDFIVSFVFGNFGFVLLLAFLALSVVADKIKKRKKASGGENKTDSSRSAIQVLANGLAPAFMALAYAITLKSVFIVAYVAALAEALSDTFASGFGVFSNKTFDLFKFNSIEKGLSGGVSIIGTLFSVLGAFIISFIAFLFGAVNVKLFLVCAVAGFFGAVFDSFLGSLFQIKYRCKKCKKIIEKPIHCDIQAEKHSGFYFFDNDVVNLFSSFFASVLASIFVLI
jgi:uncharacterized protein (TIGR00297 family)